MGMLCAWTLDLKTSAIKYQWNPLATFLSVVRWPKVKHARGHRRHQYVQPPATSPAATDATTPPPRPPTITTTAAAPAIAVRTAVGTATAVVATAAAAAAAAAFATAAAAAAAAFATATASVWRWTCAELGPMGRRCRVGVGAPWLGLG